MAIGGSSVYVGSGAFVGYGLGMSLTQIIPLGASWFPYLLIQFGSLMAFLLLYGDVSTCLGTWAVYLTDRLKQIRFSDMNQLQSDEVRGAFVGCKRFLMALEK